MNYKRLKQVGALTALYGALFVGAMSIDMSGWVKPNKPVPMYTSTYLDTNFNGLYDAVRVQDPSGKTISLRGLGSDENWEMTKEQIMGARILGSINERVLFEKW
jgi:hypothetical protein